MVADAAVPSSAGHQHHRRSHKTKKNGLPWVLGGLAVAAALAAGHVAIVSGAAAQAKAYLASSALARSGFFAAFSLIFLSELGDKTFFIAALLAMKLGRAVSFVGSTAALSLMTVISVGIGYAFKHVPEVLTTSAPIGEYLGAAMMVYFGLRTLKDAWDRVKQESSDDEESELGEAEVEVSAAEQGGKITSGQTRWQALLEVGSLIFVAEWGDRSMLATIALGAAQSPFGVAGGAILAHAVATLVAVLGGAVLSKHISETTVGFLGGSLFLVFAAATVFGFF